MTREESIAFYGPNRRVDWQEGDEKATPKFAIGDRVKSATVNVVKSHDFYSWQGTPVVGYWMKGEDGGDVYMDHLVAERAHVCNAP